MTPTELRDRAMRMARRDPVGALPHARNIPDPWFRAQALAAVARWIEDDRVGEVADEALEAAANGRDDHQRAAVAAWPIRALVEREFLTKAVEALAVARQRALAATPASSRADALFCLLQAAWGLGAKTRQGLVEDLAATHAQDSFWRVTRCLVDALVMVRATEPALAKRIAEGIVDPRARDKFARALEQAEPLAPQEYF